MSDQKEPRALSQAQFKSSGFETHEYVPITDEGVFIGKLDLKVWGNQSNLISFITLYDGRKIRCNTYPSNNYLGIDKISVESILELHFAKTSRGNLGLTRIIGI